MHYTEREFTRRTAINSLVIAAGLVVVGCGRADTKQTEESETTAQKSTVAARPAAMTVYRDPSCGCCEAWAEIARKAGYQVTLIDHPDMPAIKRKYRVPDQLRSCHTAVVGPYAIEGHVPLKNVKRLLAERPAQLRGIAVAGMPLGSPGMELPEGTREPFEVMAFDAVGTITPFPQLGGR